MALGWLWWRAWAGGTLRGRRGTWRLFSRGRSWSAEDVLGVLAKANWMEAEVVAPPGS